MQQKIQIYAFPPLLKAVGAALGVLIALAPPLAAAHQIAPPLPVGDALIGRVWDSSAERFLPLDALAYRLAAARWVILGEQHDNPDHHRLQARFLAAMVAAGRRPALAVEMIEGPQQDTLDHLATSGQPVGTWGMALRWQDRGWPAWSLYSPIFAEAQAAKLPLRAANLDRDALRAAARGADPDLPPTVRALQTAAVVAGHCDLISAAQAPPMVRAQVARDRAMAQAMRDGDRQSHDGAVLIAGAGHGRRDAGVPWHLQQDSMDDAIISVAMVEVAAPDANAPAPTITDYLNAYAPPTHDANSRNDKGAEAQTASAPFDYLVFTARFQRPDPCEALRARFQGRGQSEP